MTTAHPLQWPAGKPRTKQSRSSAFGKKTFATARDYTIDELRRLGARNVVISTNIPLRLDGYPYANFKMPDDRGVAVYFEWDGRQMAFACDQWDKIEHNIYAIGKTIEAMRGIERWGSSDMMKAAFTGFEALPAPTTGPHVRPWYDVLELNPLAHIDLCEIQYKKLARKHHPDNGGTIEKMIELNLAIKEARKLKGEG